MMHITKTWFEDGKMVTETIPAETVYKREWVGLTEKEILECRSVNHLYFYKAIEAKLKAKNFA